MEKLGIVFGAFCPLHQGHMDLIMRAKKENDRCVVFVCGYDNDRGGDLLPLKKRYRLISEFLQDDLVSVEMINDTELGIDESMSDSNWKIWIKKLFETLYLRGYERFTSYHWYVAEPFYKEKIDQLLPGDTCTLIDRNLNPISGTLCRDNPIKYWNKIALPFRPYFSHNILVAGTASEGKTTLVEDIGKYFGIPYSYEKGRDICAKRSNNEFDVRDFIHNIYEQHKYNRLLIHSPENSGVFISDTDNIVTLMYAKVYSERAGFSLDKVDYDLLENLAGAYISKTKWDKIFLVPPREKPIVDDGQRYMPDSPYRIRAYFYLVLKDLYDKFGYSYTELNGDYYQNYCTVKNYIENLYK